MAMNRLLNALILGLALSLAVCATGAAQSQSPPSEGIRLAPLEGYLVLQNGGVLKGKITRVGDRFHVANGADSEIRIDSSAVEAFCRDLREFYRIRAGSIAAGDLNSHLALAEWCMKQSLLAEAAEQTRLALHLDHEHPRAVSIERRLRAAANQPQAAATELPQPAANNLDHQVDAILADVAPSAMEMYVNTIQPILINRCANGGCHGMHGANELKLMRSPWGQTMTRSLTRRNLYSVLGQIDPNDPAASPLYAKAIVHHGQQREAALGPRDATQQATLLKWIESLSRNAQPRQPATISQPPEPLLQRGPMQLEGDRGPGVGGREDVSAQRMSDEFVDDEGVAHAGAAADLDDGSAAGEKRKRTIRYGAEDRAWRPRDPFDPEIFNRRHHRM